MSLRLLSYNIRYGGAGREKAIATVIKAVEPDVVVLQEATRPDVVKHLAAACGMKSCGARRGYSLAFLSRIEIAEHKWHRIRFGHRHYLELVLPGTSTRVFGVHLPAIHSNPTELRRAYELRALLRGIEKHQHGFHVVAGDFNTLAPGEQLDLRRLPARFRAIVWITGRTLRWVTIQLMLDAGYADAYRMFHTDEGYTFPTWDPHVRLDYTFVPMAGAARVKRCEIVHDAPSVRDASDHFPLLSEIGGV